MPRDITLGNGSLLVNFDTQYRLRDFYWPHVGQENHSAGHPFRFGVWVDGVFRWISDPGWERNAQYVPDTLVSQVLLRHPDLQLRIHCNDLVDFNENLYMRRLAVYDEAGRERDVRLFFCHDFHISGHEVGDTAYYEPERRALFHYKGRRWFLINLARETPEGVIIGIRHFAVGVTGIHGREGTWRDAEDGELSGNAVAQGSVDSVAGIHLHVPASGEATAWHWIAVGEDFIEVTRINRAVRKKGPGVFLDRTDHYWTLWAGKADTDVVVECREMAEHARRSLLILRTQIDNDGAIIAANDFDIAVHARDTYSYMWPRDGALVTRALTYAGYSMVSRRFFDFCHRVISPEGYLLHKFNPDGSLASSWHSWSADGRKQLPVQEDETALVLWVLWHHFEKFRDVEFIKPLYRGLVIRAAEWLASYRDEQTGLPLPSWDLWEERRGVSAWTVGAVFGGLNAAAAFADSFGEHHLALRYREVADNMKNAVLQYMWLPDRGHFARMLTPLGDGTYEAAPIVDASMIGLWYYGMFAPDDPKIASTMEAIRERLWVNTPVGGVARYENDYYHQRSKDIENIPGNPWFICTLWLAQWHIATAHTPEELEPARKIIQWAVEKSLPSGVMAEQIDPHTGEPISVSPLTWSHATLVLAVREYLDRLNKLS